ncbi:polysaccharide deacetylase family protein [Aliicoccus persicus]|uniref:Polysaccharide deacetylase n=1 Tax=Aliicoccus persicus TaxID=930138 RepID=A0A662YZZ5_9STAP|nr:polysaccharide deacetylase family protein [Aliicoccus persicus]SEV79676.1 Polysaccharide deacetylase [Aliicoccus persicus]
MKSINYFDINKENLINFENSIFILDKDEVKYRMYYNLSKGSNKIIIKFSNDVTDDMENVRNTAFVSNSSLLIIEEVSSTINEIDNGFGIGNDNLYYVEEYKNIILKIVHLIDINHDDIYFYGEYEGAFIPLLLSIFIKDSNAIVHNPVNFVQKISATKRKELYKTLFPGLSDDEILKKYLRKFSTTIHMKKDRTVPKIFYIQNKIDDTFNKQYIPFINNLKKYSIYDGSLVKLMYSNKELINNKLSEDKLGNILNSIIDNDGFQYIEDNNIFNSKASLVFLDDDSREASYEILYKFARENQLPVTFGVNSGHIKNGTKNRMSYNQFLEMKKDKNIVEFVNHTHSHIRLTELDYNEIDTEIRLCQEFLEEHGIFTSHLIYPFGKVNDQIMKIASKYVSSASKTNGKIVDFNHADYNKYLLNRVAFETEIEKIEKDMIEAARCNGCLIINIHTQYSTFSTEKLGEIVKLSKKYNVDILHLSNAVKRSVK